MTRRLFGLVVSRKRGSTVIASLLVIRLALASSSLLTRTLELTLFELPWPDTTTRDCLELGRAPPALLRALLAYDLARAPVVVWTEF